jgi:hypothetical protein
VQSSNADYRFCSNGVIPICTGNFWEYRENPQNPPTIRRVIAQVLFLGNTDYYTMIQAPLPSGNPDTLYYWRNFANEGCKQIDWPMPITPIPQTVFQYPAEALNFYHFEGDCVEVLATNTIAQTRDSVYHNVYAYERFSVDHYYKYFVVPEQIGLVVEEMYNVGGSTLQRRYELSGYEVNN